MDSVPIIEHWPTLDSAVGCEDCREIHASTDRGRCRACGSRSTYYLPLQREDPLETYLELMTKGN